MIANDPRLPCMARKHEASVQSRIGVHDPTTRRAFKLPSAHIIGRGEVETLCLPRHVAHTPRHALGGVLPTTFARLTPRRCELDILL